VRTPRGAHERVDLQREADEQRPWTVKSEDDSVRLERFKQGKLDRWGRTVGRFTNVHDYYVERRDTHEPW
jgi:hypothetical protein